MVRSFLPICAIWLASAASGFQLTPSIHDPTSHGSVWQPSLSSLLASTTTNVQPSALTTDEKTAIAIAFVKKQMELMHVPGLGLSVVYENKPVIVQGFGSNEVGSTTNPVTTNSVFQIGGYSMTFIAVAIAKLVSESFLLACDQQVIGRRRKSDVARFHQATLAVV
ncbi:Aste57867_4281 [Aphanomyces stellatus]|uniref:Aste57867_4281 protein n=1 Tax=Aphanomyces stellatus TaxID=120398 RepID=A0A485KDL1_9STRA|nr:hypothetical protein As57867_004270 [Aphanomyces stellatus]VFT81396.1 Aste57867_4281 [Aphanomyces stellatus]